MIKRETFSINDTKKAKGIATLLLLFHHLYYTLDDIGTYINLSSGGQEILMSAAAMARTCVWIFVFLSGYGMSYTLDKTARKDVVKFVSIRLVSIYSLFLPILIIYYVCAFLKQDYGKAFDRLVYIIANIMGISDLFGAPHLVGGFWYIGFTIVVILFFPFFYNMCEKYKYVSIPMAVVMFVYLGDGIYSYSGGRYTSYIYALLLGALFYQNNIFAKVYFEGRLCRIILSVGLFLGAILLSAIGSIYFVSEFWDIRWIIISLSAVCFCLSAYYINNNNFLAKGLILIGKYSGCIYLLHPLLIRYMKGIIFFSHNIIISYICFLILSVCFAIVWERLLQVLKYDVLVGNIKRRMIG